MSLAIVFEEIARVWMGVAGVIGSHSLACRMIAAHGTEEQKQTLLPELASGVRRTGIGLTEPGAGSDLQGIATRAWRDGDDYIVRGTKMWITNARYADPLPCLVKTDPDASPRHKGMSILLVPMRAEGVTVTRDLGKLGYKGPETCEVVTRRRARAGHRAARRRRRPRHATSAVRAGVRAHQHRGPRRRRRQRRGRRGARVP